MGEKGISGKNCRGLPVDDVIRGPASPKIIVVHRRKIVMDKGVGMDQLQRKRQRQQSIRIPPHRFDGGQSQHGADPLPSGEEAVPDPLGQATVLTRELLVEKGLKSPVHTFFLLIKIGRDLQAMIPFNCQESLRPERS